MAEMRWKPILDASVMLIITMGSSLLLAALTYPSLSGFGDYPWLANFTMHVSMFVISLFIIWWLSGGKVRDYGLNLRSSDLRLASSFLIGMIFALVMALIDYLPPLVHGSFKIDYEPNFINLLGTMSYMWIVVGMSEETLFRGLIQTYLMHQLHGKVRILRWGFHQGTIITAVIFGMTHLLNIMSKPPGFVIPQIIYTTVWGLILGYFYQESNSLIGPIIMHDSGDGFEHTIEYLLYRILF